MFNIEECIERVNILAQKFFEYINVAAILQVKDNEYIYKKQEWKLVNVNEWCVRQKYHLEEVGFEIWQTMIDCTEVLSDMVKLYSVLYNVDSNIEEYGKMDNECFYSFRPVRKNALRIYRYV